MEHLAVVAQGVSMTLLLTLSSLLFGAIGGVPLVLGRRSRIALVRFIARALIELLRGIPPLAWLFIIYFGVGTGVIELSSFAAAVIGFGLVSSAYMAEIYSGGLTAIQRCPGLVPRGHFDHRNWSPGTPCLDPGSGDVCHRIAQGFIRGVRHWRPGHHLLGQS